MQRDDAVVRKILEYLEASNVSLKKTDISITGITPAIFDYHWDLLVSAGLINGSGNKFSLTWAGHDYLRDIRRAKEISDAMASWIRRN